MFFSSIYSVKVVAGSGKFPPFLTIGHILEDICFQDDVVSTFKAELQMISISVALGAENIGKHLSMDAAMTTNKMAAGSAK